MALTEAQIQAMNEEVGEVDLADSEVQSWVELQIKMNETSLKQLQAQYRFYRFMGKQAEMEQARDNVVGTKLGLDEFRRWLNPPTIQDVITQQDAVE